MLNVALTGNIAAGKSTVVDWFREWGATVVDADRIVRDLQQPGTPVFDAIVDRFGTGVVASDGTLDRAALRARILADETERLALNAIVHPAVMARRAELVAAARAAGVRIVINDIPLLFEVADLNDYDCIVLVDAPASVRAARLVTTRGLDRAQADALIAAQQPSGPKRARSDHVIDNDGDRAALERRAREVWAALEARAGA